MASTRKIRGAGCWLAMGGVLLLAGCVTRLPAPRGLPAAISYWHEERREPRPLQIHILRIDLSSPDIEIAAAVTADPDGDGPAEARLVSPERIVEKRSLLAAVNTNAFTVVTKPPLTEMVQYPDGATVTVLGLAAEDGILRSLPEAPYIAFWVDRSGRPSLGNPGPEDEVWQGVAGFGWLVREGRIVATGEPLHPRTAVGLDATRRHLFLVVVDGRQPGYSEGMSTPELADLMLGLGCHEAVNLDGGGSSVMLVEAADGARRVINRPSSAIAGVHLTRSVPVMIGVRRR